MFFKFCSVDKPQHQFGMAGVMWYVGLLCRKSSQKRNCNKLALFILFCCSFLSTSGNKTTLYGVECGIIAQSCELSGSLVWNSYLEHSSALAKQRIMLVFRDVMKLRSHYVIIWIAYFILNSKTAFDPRSSHFILIYLRCASGV
jgi:hypothetical protein